MASKFCEVVQKEIQGIIEHATSALRLAKEKNLLVHRKYIPRMEEQVHRLEETLKDCHRLYAQEEDCSRKKCLWNEGNHGHNQKRDLDITLYHMCKKQFEDDS